MRVKQIDKCQFFLTVTESELLIVEGYSKLFNMTIQESALVMCVNGWNSYAQKMMQYSKNIRIEANNLTANRLLDNERLLTENSDEAVRFNKSMSNVMLDIANSASSKIPEVP